MADRHVTLSIGDVSQRTGVSVAALRMWERRHGFPRPQRRPSGHRRYTDQDVADVGAVEQQRRAGLPLELAIRRVTSRAGSDPLSVHAVLLRRHPDLVVHRLRKQTLVALSRAIEDHYGAYALSGHVYGAFQHEQHYRAAQARWVELARVASLVTVFADFAVSDRDRRPQEIALPDDSPMRREWAVVCSTVELPVVLSAWEIGGQHDVEDAQRLFEAVWTVEPSAVRDAVRTCVAVRSASEGTEAAPRTGRDAAALGVLEAPDRHPEPAAVSALTNRMIAYVDRAWVPRDRAGGPAGVEEATITLAPPGRVDPVWPI